MKKLPIIIILIILTAMLTSCEQVLYAVLEEIAETQDTEVIEVVVDSSQETASNDTSNIDSDMPTLPDLDYSNMSLFDDGYEIVEYRSNPDGDTATFIVSGTPLTARFLAIDTAEMNYDKGGPEPWAEEAKAYTEIALKNANTIILEADDNCDVFDEYDRLLVWIWVDGELLNYKLVSNGLAYVKYLYDDYQYNDDLLKLESKVKSQNIGLWGNGTPSTSSSNSGGSGTSSNDKPTVYSIDNARNMGNKNNITVTGTVTNIVGHSAFIEDKTGGIYVFAKKEYDELKVGNEINITGDLTEYKGLLELTNIGDTVINVLDTNVIVQPKTINLRDIGEDIESQYVRVNNLTIKDIDSYTDKGYNIYVTDGSTTGVIRIDRYLSPYPNASFISVGDKIDVIGNVAQHEQSYQIMIGSSHDIIK